MSSPVLATLDSTLKDVGSFASIALALLVLFSDRRARTLEGWQHGSERTSKARALWTIAFDVGLVLFTVGVLLATSPLLVDALDELSVGRERGVVRTLFALVWAGFAVLAVFQCWIVCSRVGRFDKISW